MSTSPKLSLRILLFTLSLSLLGFSQLSAADPNYEIYYSKGTKAYDEGKVDEAQKELQKALKIMPNSKEASYVVGIIEQEKGDHKGALKTFNTVYKQDKLYKNLLFHVALSYYELKKDKLAEKFFERQIENTKDKDILDQSNFYLAKIFERTERADLAKEHYDKIALTTGKKTSYKHTGKWWFFNGYPGFQYDTNVALISKGVATPPDLSGKDSARIYVALNGGVIPVRKENMALSLAYTYYHGFNLMNGLSRYNINQHTFAVDSVFRKVLNDERNIKFYLGYDYNLSLISNSFDFYSQSHTIKPEVEINWSKRYSSKFPVKITYDDFYFSAFAEDDRDAYNMSAGFIETYKFNGLKSKVYFGFDYERNLASGYNFNYYGLTPLLGLSTPLYFIDRIDLDASFTFRRFVNFRPDPVNFPTIHREEYYTYVSLNLMKKITDNIEVNINETFIYNESFPGYSYKRNIVSLIFGFLY